MSIEERVREYFMDMANIAESELDMNADIFARYGMDSIKAVKIISDIEVEYDIDIPDESAQKICTLNDVVTIINEQLQGAGA